MAMERFTSEEANKVGAAKDLVVRHALAQAETDKLIAKIPDAKKKMEYASKKAQIRAQSEGMVGSLTRKFLELADRVQNLFSEDEPKPKPGGIFTTIPSGKLGGFGFFPAVLLAEGAIKVAVIGAALGISYAAARYATAIANEKQLQAEILADKTLSALDKQSLLNVVGGGSGFGGKLNMLFLGALIAIGGYYYFQKKGFKHG